LSCNSPPNFNNRSGFIVLQYSANDSRFISGHLTDNFNEGRVNTLSYTAIHGYCEQM